MAGTWRPLTNQPAFSASTMLLLTDGTVMCQESDTPNWWKLTPDSFGNYANGTWSSLSPMMNAPLYYASAVLADGRVFVAGGEYNAGAQVDLLAAEIYDPVANTWTSLSTPAGWTNIGDAPCCVFPDGRVIIGSIGDQRTAIYDPVANTWTAGANKNDACSEETWTLLPDGTILVADCTNHPNSEKYVIASDQWVPAGSTVCDLVEAASIEIGPAILLPDGRVFACGATSNTALYTMPAVATDPGTWVCGPTFPPQAPNQVLGAKDAPACLLPNGRVLCVAGPVDGQRNSYLSPSYFFEFNPTSSTLTVITSPPNSGREPYHGRMLLLPTGEVLFANETFDIEVYSPDGMPDAAWQPQITACSTSLRVNQTYTLSGLRLNGLSQAVSYGDDAAMATNYPLVRIRNLSSNKIVYSRTFNHSTMGVATGNAVISAQFTVPPWTETGASELSVIANGIPSAPLAVTVHLTMVKQDILAQFGRNSGLIGTAGYYVANEGTQHVIVGFSAGALNEVFWRSGQSVHQDTLTTFSGGSIVDVGGYFNPDEGTQHAIVGTRDGKLTEVYWKSGQGVHQDVLTSFSGVFLGGIAGYYISNEGTQHVIVATSDGALTEVFWRSGQGVHLVRLATFPAGIVDVGGYFNSDEGTQHAIVGISDGSLIEVYWKSGQGVHQNVLTSFNSSIVGVAGYYVTTEGTQHAIVGTVDGVLTEVFWRSGQGVQRDTLATFPAGIIDVGGYFNPDEGTQHAIASIHDGSLVEVFW